MAKKCLITASLVSSINWANSAPNSVIKPEKGGDGVTTWKVKALRDLKSTLARAPFDPNVAAERGIAFENQLYSRARSGQADAVNSEHFNKILKQIIGGEFQRKIGANYSRGGEDFYLYGKEDVYFKDLIIDIKTTARLSINKYVDSFQHILYAYIEKMYQFRYLIAVWDEYPQIATVKQLDLNLDPDRVQSILDTTLDNTVAFLKDNRLWEVYRETYCLY